MNQQRSNAESAFKNCGPGAAGMSIPNSGPTPAFVQKNFQIGDGNLFSVLTPPSQPQAAEKRSRSSANKTQTKGRRKCRWKLKFHHQALPPEYREHYEASGGVPQSTSTTVSERVKKEEQPKSAKSSTPSPRSTKSSASSRSSVIMPSFEPCAVDRPAPDLPYMGEITLDSKPRRGRKPKKADICHLIYKNYGTVFPSPKNEEEVPIVPNVPLEKPSKLIWAKDPQQLMAAPPKPVRLAGWSPQAASSLLEKRLTASEAGHQFLMPNDFPAKLCDFPLNRKKSTSSSSVRTSSDGDELLDASLVRSPQLAQACVERLLSYAAAGFNPQKDCVQMEPLNLCTRDKKPAEDGLLLMSSSSDSEDEESDKRDLPHGPPDGFVFWPNPNVFVHPQLLYKPPSPGNVSQAPPSLLQPPQKLHLGGNKKKRKRSAIFIPPAESPTEVSICKFKFTGGAKPSLEEKKMLSVDAGGNFRFYSGTDKGMRSFLPHLQHSSSSTPSTSVQAPRTMPSTSVSPTQGVKNLNLSDRVVHPRRPSPQPSRQLLAPPMPNFLTSPEMHDDLLTKRKRRSRKSEVREKLEKTFKEKGFLIQTQQLESAEGAGETTCPRMCSNCPTAPTSRCECTTTSRATRDPKRPSYCRTRHKDS
ncbi:uncharacterized protein LOC132198969 isoform X2 [Neocloeon triangulifer]|uniref:uncharacterized protein LOC132198969 isoform X2 n=1 Tax=Neocloeon triangulifer TaxID=2078957 RepID=UPI00286FA4A4|nr:uncharacterized protein LOC132198969 isoform X2 [Neocloeon triangulifer]